VIGALILIALAVLLARKGRQKRMEQMRVEADEHRAQARVRARTAEREQADADEAAARAAKARAAAEEQAAQARRAEAEAEAKAEHAHHERSHAEELHGRAQELDPDGDREGGGPQGAFERNGDERGEGCRRFDRDDETAARGDAGAEASGARASGASNQVPAQPDDRTRR
jgi:hypothetical protein